MIKPFFFRHFYHKVNIYKGKALLIRSTQLIYSSRSASQNERYVNQKTKPTQHLSSHWNLCFFVCVSCMAIRSNVSIIVNSLFTHGLLCSHSFLMKINKETERTKFPPKVHTPMSMKWQLDDQISFNFCSQIM